jgi:ElaB/YqjD/DUF883 family membrane-anchored ribosome-binding protein
MMNEQLVNDLKSVLKEAEALLDATAHQSGGTLKTARQKLGQSVEAVRTQWTRLQDKATDTAAAGGRLVKEHPYETMGAGVLIAAFAAGAYWMWRNSR